VMHPALKAAFEYYLANQKSLVELYDGKYIAIKDGTVLGSFDSELEAVQETSKKHMPGTFLVQLVSPGDEAYTQTFHSRVVFA
jgi:hypothetical protein